jgi:hypothetical protein
MSDGRRTGSHEHGADLAEKLGGEGEDGVRKRSATEDVPILPVSLRRELWLTKVGTGLTPRPLLTPQMAVRVVLLGAIHVIHEKSDRAWKMKFGNQKSAVRLWTTPVYCWGPTAEHQGKGNEEELVPRPGVDPAEGARDRGVTLAVEGLVQCEGWQDLRPDAEAWVDRKGAAEACKAESSGVSASHSVQNSPQEVHAKRVEDLVAVPAVSDREEDSIPTGEHRAGCRTALGPG